MEEIPGNFRDRPVDKYKQTAAVGRGSGQQGHRGRRESCG